MTHWRPSTLTIVAWACLAAAVVMQRLRIAPIGNVLAFAIYFIFWWVSLFVVLPFGVRTQSDDGAVVQGTSAGAPIDPRIGRTAALTTIVATVTFGVLLLALRYKLIPLDVAG